LVNLSGKVERTISTNGLTVSDDLSFSPDGRQLVFWSPTSKNSGDSRLYTLRIDVAGARPTAITPAGSHDVDPDFSPDGRQIVFSRQVGSRAQIAVVDTDGSNPKVLTLGASNSAGPVFSPDGRQIAYKSAPIATGSPARYELWVLTAASPKNARAVVIGDTGSISGSPAWGNR
jgi:TolB protein